MNERRDIALTIAGSHLLDSLRISMLKLGPGKALRMHISGQAGAGQSSVVEALKCLAASWGSSHEIPTVVPKGIAAVLINGETVLSRFLIQSRSISREKETEEINEWSKVFMHIWDEICIRGRHYLQSVQNCAQISLHSSR